MRVRLLDGREAEGFEKGGIEIHLRDGRTDDAPRLDAGAFHIERHLRARGIDARLAARIADAVVAGEDDDGALRLPRGFELLQHRADEFINVPHARVILREIHARGGRVRHPRQHRDRRRFHILRRGVAILRVHQLALHMLPPRRVRVAGIAPEEPRLVSRALDDRVEVIVLHEHIVGKIPRGLLMQFARERAIHSGLRVEPIAGP